MMGFCLPLSTAESWTGSSQAILEIREHGAVGSWLKPGRGLVMRVLLFAIFTLFAAGLPPAQAQVARAACPVDAEKASYSIWPAGSLPAGTVRQRLHPCGRRLECIGARPTDAKRTCRWLLN